MARELLIAFAIGLSIGIIVGVWHLWVRDD